MNKKTAGISVKGDQVRLILLVVLLLVGVVIVAANFVFDKPQPVNNQNKLTSTSPANSFLESDSTSYKVGKEYSLKIWVNSDSQEVNAAQVYLSYPKEYIEVTGLDYADSPFDVKAESIFEGGKIMIARGAIDPVSGKQLLATVKFKPVQNVNSVVFKYDATNTLLIRTLDNTNILNETAGLQLSVGE